MFLESSFSFEESIELTSSDEGHDEEETKV
jgi:hypothetical protein